MGNSHEIRVANLPYSTQPLPLIFVSSVRGHYQNPFIKWYTRNEAFNLRMRHHISFLSSKPPACSLWWQLCAVGWVSWHRTPLLMWCWNTSCCQAKVRNRRFHTCANVSYGGTHTVSHTKATKRLSLLWGFSYNSLPLISLCLCNQMWSTSSHPVFWKGRS